MIEERIIMEIDPIEPRFRGDRTSIRIVVLMNLDRWAGHDTKWRNCEEYETWWARRLRHIYIYIKRNGRREEERQARRPHSLLSAGMKKHLIPRRRRLSRTSSECLALVTECNDSVCHVICSCLRRSDEEEYPVLIDMSSVFRFAIPCLPTEDPSVGKRSFQCRLPFRALQAPISVSYLE